MNHLELKINIIVTGSFHTTGNRLLWDADKATARSASGKLVLPATHVKGVLRDAVEKALHTWNLPACHGPGPESMCTDEKALCLVCQVFGNAHARAKVRFPDFLNDQDLVTNQVRSGVSISRQRRTSLAQRLYFVETAEVNGLALSGTVEGFFSTPEAAQQAAALIVLGSKFNPQVGGGRSRGLGWTKCWEVTTRVDGQTLSPEVFAQAWKTWSGGKSA